MKFTKGLKLALTSAFSVATLAATMSVANAYTIDRDTANGSAISILDISNGHFVFTENEAIKQARSFKLNVEISDYSNASDTFPAQVTLQYGSCDSNGNEVPIGTIVKNGAHSGELTGTLTAEQVSSGKFWLKAAENSYSEVVFHSISFFDENNHCILYGSADSADKKWTFYQLKAPEISVSGNANSDGSYYYSAGVSARQADISNVTLTYGGSDENACTWGDNISTVFKKGSDTLGSNDNVNITQGNEFSYYAYTTATLTDTQNNNASVTLYSPVVKTTVKLTDHVGLSKPDVPIVVDGSALTGSTIKGRTAADILSAANALTGAQTVLDGVKLGIDGLPDCRIAKIIDRDNEGNVVRTVYVPVTYTAVQGFDPSVSGNQTVTLVGEADVSKLDVPVNYDKSVTAAATVCPDNIAVPVISPNGGTFSRSQTVSITCATDGATIYYTTDGSDPTANSTKYTKHFKISATTTVKAIAVKTGMADSTVVSATFTKKTSDSSSDEGSSETAAPKPKNPLIGGSEKSWGDVATDLSNLASGSEVTIKLNGIKTVPAEVIKAISDTNINVKFVINSAFVWEVDGSKITTPTAADLTFTKTSSTKSEGLRGIEGTQFRINDTGVPTDLEIAFKTIHAGKFANLYKNVSGKPVFVNCVKLGEDGKVILSDFTEKGSYVIMLCEFSDRPGDMNNDGIMNDEDVYAVLNDCVGFENGANPLVADMNNDDYINAKDALIILKKFLGIE